MGFTGTGVFPVLHGIACEARSGPFLSIFQIIIEVTENWPVDDPVVQTVRWNPDWQPGKGGGVDG